MKKCNSCGKKIEDDMIYCPYCGDKYHDYHDDLKDALADLDNEKPKKIKTTRKTKEEKENDVLNKILIFLICAIVVVGIGGVVMIGKSFIDVPKDPIVNDDQNQEDEVDQNDPQDDKTDSNDQVIVDDNNNIDDETNQEPNQNETENDDENVGTVIDITNEENGDFKILEFKISKEDGQVRFDIKSSTTIPGNIFLMDNVNLNIGPISIDKGESSFYFLINGQKDYTLYFDASNGREYEYHISKETIKEALKE